jgi:predicted metalloprotease
MRLDKMRESENIDDRRGQSRPVARGGKLGLGGIAVVVIIGLILGKSPLEMLNLLGVLSNPAPQQSSQQPSAADNAQSKQLVAKVLGDTEDTWQQIFKAKGAKYPPPELVLFRHAVQSACGQGSAAMGPFYCPADKKVYLDLSFFDELHQRFGAPGDFAQAYVIAHEVGHHVQNLMGVSAKVHQKQQHLSKEQGNELSVRLELQADCFAGVWGHSASQRELLDPNDMKEALVAANAIGDDTLQKSAGQAVVPDAFTHGSSTQRMAWFQRGMESGDMTQCNTFDAKVKL